KEHLVPETRVQQVQDGVLHTADVQVNATWIIRAVNIWLWTSPVTLIFNIDHRVIIDWVNVAQLVEGRTCPLRHDIRVTVVGLGSLTQVEFNRNPLLGLRQRWLWLGSSVIRIERHRLVVLDLWQLNWQHRLRQCVCLAVPVVDDWERLAPVALPCKEPVTQLVLDLLNAQVLGLQPLNGLGDGIGLAQTIDIQASIVRGVHHGAFTGVCLFGDVATGDNLRDWKLKLSSELVVTGIVRWHSHNRTGTVAHQHIVTNEDWDLLASDRVGGISADEYTGLFLVFLTLQLSLGRDVLQVSRDSILRVALAIGPLGVDIRTVIFGACQ